MHRGQLGALQTLDAGAKLGWLVGPIDGLVGSVASCWDPHASYYESHSFTLFLASPRLCSYAHSLIALGEMRLKQASRIALQEAEEATGCLFLSSVGESGPRHFSQLWVVLVWRKAHADQVKLFFLLFSVAVSGFFAPQEYQDISTGLRSSIKVFSFMDGF